VRVVDTTRYLGVELSSSKPPSSYDQDVVATEEALDV
jgi:hypothetical protein